MKVELIYDKDCPNVGKARAELMRAFSQAGVPAKWVEWDRGDPSSPPYVRAYGSPTVLVDGKDVAGAPPAGGACCRLYGDSKGGLGGAPPAELIAAALRVSAGTASSKGARTSSGWRASLAALPGIGASLLPVGICPACWPAYAGLLGSLGLGALLQVKYLFPLTAAFLALAVWGLAYKARTRRGYGPFYLGLAGSAVVLAGKFYFGFGAAAYAGVALLLAGSVWNAWPRKTAGNACPACTPAGRELSLPGGKPGISKEVYHD
jgi:hypothetical protein